MTREEAINKLVNARYADEFQGDEELTTAHLMAIKALEQEPCEDEYIKVPKKALKYRTAGMVAYNAEWLKNHFDIERIVICREQDTSGDLISRQATIEAFEKWICSDYPEDYPIMSFIGIQTILEEQPSVNPQEPKTVLYSGDGYADGYMVYDMAECPNCGYEYEDGDKDWGLSFCPSCGQKLNWESEDKE